jgi:hypothetical protein
MFLQALEGYEKTMGRNHLFTPKGFHRLGPVYQRQGLLEKAISC